MKKNLSAVSSVARVVAYAMIMLISAGKSFADDPDLAQWRMAMSTNGYTAVERKVKVSQDIQQTLWKCYRDNIGYEGVQMSKPRLVSTNEYSALYDLPFITTDCARHHFGVVLVGGEAHPCYHTTEGYASENIDDLALTVLSAGIVSNNVITKIRQVLDISSTVVSPSIGKHDVCVPFKRFYLYVSDDMPMAEWSHPVRYLFVDEDMTTFAVVYGSVPLEVVVEGSNEQFVLVNGEINEIRVPRKLLTSTGSVFDDKSGDDFPSVLDGNSSNCYALLVSGGWNQGNNHCRYWNEVCFVYNVLRKRFCLPRENIKVLWAGGDPSNDLCRNGTCLSPAGPCKSYHFEKSNLSDFDLDGNNDIDGSATLANVRSTLEAYANDLQANDQLLIFFSDHGDTYGGGVNGKATVDLWGEELTDYELASLTKDIKCPVMAALKTCYSGGMIQEFVNSSANRTIATADRYDPSLAYPMMGDWTYYFFSALCGYYPVGTPTTTSGLNPRTCGETCDADLDGDGRVSFYEAHQFAYKMNPHVGEDIPQYDESPQSANLGKKLFMTQYADAPAVVVRDKVLTPTLSPASGSLGYAPCTITAACATSGATIRYTLDGSDPTARSAVYSDGITISEDTIISIRAFKSDMDPSDVVSVSYAVKKSAPEKALITSVSQGDSSSGIVVYWSGGAGTESYDLLRSESTSMSSATTIATELLASTSCYADLTASPGKTYYYQIRSRNKYGTTLSAASQGAFLMLNPPDGVTATVIATMVSTASVKIDWNSATGASYYRVYRKTSDGTLTALGSWQIEKTYTDTVQLSGANTKVSYYVRSSAYSSGANPSGYSREVSTTIKASSDGWQMILVYPWSSTTDLGAICHRPGTSREYTCRLQYADGSFDQSDFVTSPVWSVKKGQGITLTAKDGSGTGWTYRPPNVTVTLASTAPEQTATITASFMTSGGVTVTQDFTLFVTIGGVPKSISISSPGFATPGETVQLGVRTSYYGYLSWDDEPWEAPEVTWTVIGGSGATISDDGELTAWPVTTKTNVTVQASVNTVSGILTDVKTFNVSPATITTQTAVIPPLGGESTNLVGKLTTSTYAECYPTDWISGLTYHGSKTMDPSDSTIHISVGRGRNSVGIGGSYMFLSFRAERNPGKDREMPFKLRWDGGGIDFTIIQREAPYANDPVVNGGATGTITVNSTTDGSVVHYATDGEEPSENSPVLSNSLDFNESTAFAVKAFGEWMQASDTVYTDVVGKGAQWDEVEISFDTVQAGLTTPATRTYKVNETFGDLPSYPKTNGLYFKGWTLHDGSDKLVSSTDIVPSQNAILYAVWSPIEADKPSWVALPWNFKSAIAATMKILDYSTGEYLDPSVCVIGIESGDGECRGSSENGFGDMQSELNGKDGLFVFGVYSRIESGQEAGLRIRIWSKQQGFLSVINDNVPFEVGTVLGSEADPYVVCVETENGTGAPVITFVANGGTGTMANQKVPYGIATGLNKCTFSKEGYSFKEWSGSDKKTYKDQEVVALQAKLTLTAQWTGCVYRVTLDRQGGSGGTESVLATYGDVMPSIEVPIRKACTFDGYYTSTGGNGTQYYTESGTSARKWDKPEELTLYAKWTPTIKPAVDSDSSGKGSVSGGGVVASGKSTTLKAVANSGCVFAGWYDGDGNPLKGSVDYRTTPYNYVSTGEPTEIVAKFATVEEDIASLYLVDVTNCTTEASGVFTKCMVEHIRSLSLPKLAVTGFPAGLKYNDKSMTINGKATNPGVYKITVAATNASVKKPTDATTATFMLTVPNFKDEEIDVDDSYGPYIPGVSYVVNIKTEGCAVSGLPSGFKYDAKTLTISGAPTKPGSYTVTFTKTVNKVKHTATATFTVGNMPVLTIESVGAGSASGAKAYLANAKVSLKATPEKGSIFRGWYDGEALLSQAASYTYQMPETDKTLIAKFISATDDASGATATVDGLAFDSSRLTAETNITAGVYLAWPVAVVGTLTPVASVKVTGLPSGLKFADKDIMKKGSKTEVEVPANTIYGTPTAASKTDKAGAVIPSPVKITVTTAGKTAIVYAIALTVDPLPGWAVGTFNGGSDEAQSALTVTAAGKISGKHLEDGLTWTLSAPYFDECDGDGYLATVTAKSGKIENTMTLEIGEDEAVLEEDETPVASLYQTDWKSEPWKTIAKPFNGKTLKLDDITLKFSSSGTVTATGAFVTGVDAKGKDVIYSASCAATLIPQGGDYYCIYIYFPPKAGKFAGYSERINLSWDGAAFAVVPPVD